MESAVRNETHHRNRGYFLQRDPIGIYTGEGASHSWTWFIETLEKNGFNNLVFLDAEHVRQGELQKVNTFIMGGGDAFAMAGGLGEKGAVVIKEFIESGGTYLGSCAGAYLLMNMDEYPLNLFSVTDARVLNIVHELPECKMLPEKFYTTYGHRYVLHPVRETVKLKMKEVPPISTNGHLLAPLYGGPPIQLFGQAEEIASYADFVSETLYLTDETLARKMMLGKVAAFRQFVGRGGVYLFGPHVEHPSYPEANRLVIEAINYSSGTEFKDSFSEENSVCLKMVAEQIREIKGRLSDARLVAYGLELLPITWKIGHKTYEPGKIRVFLEVVWRRYQLLEKGICENDFPELVFVKELTAEIVSLLRQIKRKIDAGACTLDEAERLFPMLKKMSTTFLGIYFRVKNQVHLS